MTTLADDTRTVETAPSRMASGLAFALVSALTFGLSGSLATGLLRSGWSPGAAVLARITVAAIVLVVPAVRALRGRWHLLRTHAGTILAYGLIAIAGCQLCYFLGVERVPVAVALLIEYTAPVAVLLWLWLIRGQRPTWVTVAGGIVAGGGLALVVGITGGVALDVAGVLWSLGAMVGAAVYFILSGNESELPPLTLAGGGLVVGTVVLGLAGLVGIVPMAATTLPAAYAGVTVPWWLPVLGLGVVTAAIAYTTGIAGARRLGSRLASFVALSEVLAAVLFAWLLLAQLPRPVQLLGGALILAGVVLVRVGETPRRRRLPKAGRMPA
ncbi:EamA family transporter [Mariniluteicoccus flavus]